MSNNPSSSEQDNLKSSQQKITDDIRVNKDIAAASYIPLLGIMILFKRKDSPFVHFHARQGLVLFFIWIVLYVIPSIGNMISLIAIAGMFAGFITAAMGEYYRIIFIADIAEHGINAKQIRDLVKKGSFYLVSFLKRIFKKHEKTTDNSASDTSSTREKKDKLHELVESAKSKPVEKNNTLDLKK